MAPRGDDTGGEYVRATVVLDDVLVREAKALTGLKTKRAVLDEALWMLIRIRKQERIRELFGTVEWEGDLDDMRRSRFTDDDL
jgi:Arc/MetJ family transcription regulator